VLVAVSWYLVAPILAAGVFGFWAGKLIRDFQWYARLASEWETTIDLIDWPLVEMLAAEHSTSNS
jgi:hypothetical protein